MQDSEQQAVDEARASTNAVDPSRSVEATTRRAISEAATVPAPSPRQRAPRRATALVLLSVLAPGDYGRRMAAWAGALLLLGIGWSSPIAFGGLQWGDAALGLGRPDLAVAQYDRVARWTPFVDVHRQALNRSAVVYAVELGNPVQARRRLEWLARISPEGPQRADVKERIALLLLEERQPLEAARLLREAHQACPACADAPRRLVRAAELLADYGDPSAAEEVYAQVVEGYPAHRARANVGRAELLLGRGAALEALALFEDAADRTFDADLQAVAKLGMATCLERLGNLDEALAELDAADLPDRARRMRSEGMRARITDTTGAPGAAGAAQAARR